MSICIKRIRFKYSSMCITADTANQVDQGSLDLIKGRKVKGIKRGAKVSDGVFKQSKGCVQALKGVEAGARLRHGNSGHLEWRRNWLRSDPFKLCPFSLPVNPLRPHTHLRDRPG